MRGIFVLLVLSLPAIAHTDDLDVRGSCSQGAAHMCLEYLGSVWQPEFLTCGLNPVSPDPCSLEEALGRCTHLDPNGYHQAWIYYGGLNLPGMPDMTASYQQACESAGGTFETGPFPPS